MTFKDYYKFPLKPMVGCERLKVLTADNQMAFDWCDEFTDNFRNNIISCINGNGSFNKSYLMNYIFYENDTGIVGINFGKEDLNCSLLRIRGWGHLTGIGGLHLSEEEAKAIQDEFGEYIVKMLNS